MPFDGALTALRLPRMTAFKDVSAAYRKIQLIYAGARVWNCYHIFSQCEK